ncbi:MAG: lycopene cyclase domain-containing protein, partial [Chloroflexi bacterium]|nr:lycopene cyclase domain-containing protein [Chloroflexota bacterium]
LYPAVANRLLLKSDVHEVNWRVLTVFAASFIVCFVIGTSLLHINSIITSTAALLATATFIVYQRPDLLKAAVTSGLLTLVLFTLVFFVLRLMYPQLLEAWCTGCNPSGVVLLGVNLEELIWDAAWGACGGVLFPALAGYRLENRMPVLAQRA